MMQKWLNKYYKMGEENLYFAKRRPAVPIGVAGKILKIFNDFLAKRPTSIADGFHGFILPAILSTDGRGDGGGMNGRWAFWPSPHLALPGDKFIPVENMPEEWHCHHSRAVPICRKLCIGRGTGTIRRRIDEVDVASILLQSFSAPSFLNAKLWPKAKFPSNDSGAIKEAIAKIIGFWEMKKFLYKFGYNMHFYITI